MEEIVRSPILARDITYIIFIRVVQNLNSQTCFVVDISLPNSNMISKCVIDLFVICCRDLSYLGNSQLIFMVYQILIEIYNTFE
jgi:hypothetical protein